MDIVKCLTISTGHVSMNTMLYLQEEPEVNRMGLTVYEKNEFGFWIWCPENLTNYFGEENNIPEDLWKCMLLAYENDCRWLCLDSDGEEVEGLEMFDW